MDSIMKTHIAILLLALAVLTGCGGGSKTKQAEPTAFVTTKTVAEKQQPDPIGPLELQAAVMAFADTTNSRLAQVTTKLNEIGTPQARVTAARMKVFDISANVEIAAGPYPGIALLDMIVLTSLRRIVWEEYWIPEVFGEEARPSLSVYREAEKDIWNIAAKIMTPEQLDELAKVILDWRKRNPNQVSVNYVRFDDFGDLGLKPSMRKLTVPGGLFASVKEATMVAQDIKVSIDRAFYLMSRMQLVLSFQIELAYVEMLFQPEADGIVDTTQRLTGVTERYAEIAENLPDKISAETAGLINLLFANLAQNRDETIAQILTGLTQWQDQTISGVMTSVSTEREAAIEQAISGLIVQQEALFKQMDTIVDQGGDEMEDTLNHAFMLGVLLILIFFAALSAYKLFVARPVDKQQPRQ